MRTDENLQKKDRLLESRNEITKCQGDESGKKEHKKYLAYGEFDRIGFEKVEKFSKYRDISENARAWVGDRQTHLVYSICQNESENEVFYEDGEFYERQGDEVLKSDRLFLGISILQMKYSEKEKCNNMGDYLKTCREQILHLVQESGLDVKCTVMGTLGSFGLTILWLADQYIDVLSLVTLIRNQDISKADGDKKSIFLSSYTIFAQNHENGDTWNERILKIKGNAIVSLTLKKGAESFVCNKLAKWKIEDSNLYHCAGEHDMMIRMESSKVFKFFNHGYELNFDADFYKEYVLQSSVDLCEIQNIPEEIDTESKKKSISNNGIAVEGKQKVIPELDAIIEKYQELRVKFAEIFPSTTGMVDTLDMLFGDYISKVSSASNELWVDTFSHQFLQVLNCILVFSTNLRELNIPREKALMYINDLLCDFERQISHMAESNNLILGTPICQFRYSGQNNLTLYAYFGIIKNILKNIYEKQDISRQDEIVPLIVADIVPIIQSTMYIDYKDNREISKIITINLPMVALYNPVCYYPYLYHEIFHYIVPKDRFGRNKIIGSMISMELLLSAIKMSMRNAMKSKSREDYLLLDDFIEKHLMPYIYMFVINNYDLHIAFGMDNNDKSGVSYTEIRDNEFVAATYEQTLFSKWIEWFNADGGISRLDDNLIYKFMCYLYIQKNDIQGEISSWINSNLQNERMNDVKEVINDSLNQIYAMAENEESIATWESFLEIISSCDETVLNDASIFVDALKEALADIAMVSMGNMSFPEYLLLFTKTKKDLLIDIDDSKNMEQDILRVGVILDYLCANDINSNVPVEMIDRLKKDYLYLFCGMFYSNHKANKEGDEEYKKKLLAEGENWFAYWRTCCLRYLEKYRIYASLTRELSQLTLAENEVDSIYWKQYAESLRNLGYYILEKKNTEAAECWIEFQSSIEQNVFNLNIDWIHNFQNQSIFSELNAVRESKIIEKKEELYDKEYSLESLRIVNSNKMEEVSRRNIMPKWEYYVGSVGEIATIIAGIAESLTSSNQRVLGKREYPLWYRGQVSDKYLLLPSVMRAYKKKRENEKEKDSFWLSTLLKREYEEFKFRADGAPETIDRVGYTDGDYIALMQHYSVASNFLDWTEDALSALYFSLESFLDTKVKNVNENAAVYIFSPALYNHARAKILSDKNVKKASKTFIEYKLSKTRIQENIPNLTVSYNADNYFMYLLGDEECDEQTVATYKGNEEDKHVWKFYMPMAIYVSRLNDRIRAQSGIFMAYNVYTKPDENDEFKYIALENIQENYLNEYKEDRDTCPFLYKVIIKEDKRKEIAEWVKAFGMSKEKCYPELVNIGERIMR